MFCTVMFDVFEAKHQTVLVCGSTFNRLKCLNKQVCRFSSFVLLFYWENSALSNAPPKLESGCKMFTASYNTGSNWIKLRSVDYHGFPGLKFLWQEMKPWNCVKNFSKLFVAIIEISLLLNPEFGMWKTHWFNWKLLNSFQTFCTVSWTMLWHGSNVFVRIVALWRHRLYPCIQEFLNVFWSFIHCEAKLFAAISKPKRMSLMLVLHLDYHSIIQL